MSAPLERLVPSNPGRRVRGAIQHVREHVRPIQTSLETPRTLVVALADRVTLSPRADVHLRAAWWTGLATVALVLVSLLAATVGPVAIHPLTVAKATLNGLVVPAGLHVGAAPLGPRIGGIRLVVPTASLVLAHPFDFAVPETAAIIVQGIRLPRIALAAVVGFALGAAGTLTQGVFRNPLADPAIIGVSSGAAVGAVAVIALPLAMPVGLQPAAFAGALLAAAAVYLLATENGRTPVATLLLAGVAVQTFLGAVVSYLLLHAGQSLERAIFWLMGHLTNATWAEVGATLPVAVLATVAALAYARDLNVLLLGEADARALGVEVERVRRLLLTLASLATAAAVAVAGVVGFVGLVVPHVVRLVVGPDHRVLLPTSAVGGAAFLVAADTVARAGAAELPVGVVTAAIGAPFFLYLLRTREVHRL